jgi:hypothetical protein
LTCDVFFTDCPTQVGSAFELVQRLDDAIDSPTSPSDPISQSPDDATPMHLFDIRRSNSVIELWKNVEKRSSVTLARQRPPHLPQSPPTADLSYKPETTATRFTQNSLGESESQEQSRDYGTLHSRWLAACSPPKLPSKEVPLSESQVDYTTLPKASSFETTTLTSAPQLKGSEKTTSLSNITEEGRRQVSLVQELNVPSISSDTSAGERSGKSLAWLEELVCRYWSCT